jgi:hypothetical protein
MTDVYNRFHNPDGESNSIAELRRLHEAMDRTVLDAYGWGDIEAGAAFGQEWTDENGDGPWRCRWPEVVRDEVLARLLALNADRAADEARQGLSVGSSGRRAQDVEDSGEFELEAE